MGKTQILWIICVLAGGSLAFCDLSHFLVGLELPTQGRGWQTWCLQLGENLCARRKGWVFRTSGLADGCLGWPEHLSSLSQHSCSLTCSVHVDSERPPLFWKISRSEACLSPQGLKSRLSGEGPRLLIRTELEGRLGLCIAGERSQVIRYKVQAS